VLIVLVAAGDSIVQFKFTVVSSKKKKKKKGCHIWCLLAALWPLFCRYVALSQQTGRRFASPAAIATNIAALPPGGRALLYLQQQTCCNAGAACMLSSRAFAAGEKAAGAAKRRSKSYLCDGA
jgi:hypothetical protein